jgi:SUMO ligase MMS21 Smc5/6 complex component
VEEVPAKLPVKAWAAHISKVTGVEISPQLVHYYLRTNEEFRQAATNCECGRRVLIVEVADKIWKDRLLEEN